jgi:uncharacterized protein (TIGR00730 family)
MAEQMIKRATVFCASSNKIEKYYTEEAYKLGELLAGSGIELIYGGGKAGLMGAISSGALSAGGRVIGVIPKFMDSLELGRKDIAELRIVKDMHERVKMLIEDSDILIALPGGVGTFDELMQAIAWKTLGLIIKPILLVNTNNFFVHIMNALDDVEIKGFMHVPNKNLWRAIVAPSEVLQYIQEIQIDVNTINVQKTG